MIVITKLIDNKKNQVVYKHVLVRRICFYRVYDANGDGYIDFVEFMVSYMYSTSTVKRIYLLVVQKY
jgi:hypothetical protein